MTSKQPVKASSDGVGGAMRVLVCGGRDFVDEHLLTEALDLLHKHCGPVTVLIHGAATGADSIAAAWATNGQLSERIHVIPFRANWRKHGKAAGPMRNLRMLQEGKPDRVVAFAGGKGTANMVKQAEECGVPIWHVTDKWPPDSWVVHSRPSPRQPIADETT